MKILIGELLDSGNICTKSTEKEILLDVDEATKMLRLLQYKDDDPIILCCYGQTNCHPPRPTNENYDWQTVTTLAAKKGRSGLFNSVQKDLLILKLIILVLYLPQAVLQKSVEKKLQNLGY